MKQNSQEKNLNKRKKNLNQILISKKLYVTPEIKNKAKNSNTIFVISSILMVIILVIYLCQSYLMELFFNNRVEIGKYFNFTTSNNQIEITEYEDIDFNLKEDKSDSNYNKVFYDNKEFENTEDGTVIVNTDENLNYSKAEVITDYHDNKLLKNGTIEIPKIKVNYPIVIPPIQNNETVEKCLKFAPTKYAGPDLGQPGNYCITGHNYRNSLFFSKLKNLEIGDIIQLSDIDENLYEFKIYKIYTVDISDTTCLSQNTYGKTEVTLITCTDDNKERFIVKASLI